MGIDLSVIWMVVIFFGVMMYVVMDGFDLGIGILFPFAPAEHDRDVMMNTVAPVWDGNETWLVLGGAALLAAFPLVYSVVLSALYLPIIFMLLGLILRGVAFEFRFKCHDHERHLWDKAFILGSLSASFFQGVVLGAYIQGIPVVDRAFAGGPFDWVAPFPLFTGLGVVVAYALLGSTWLILKTEGPLQAKMIRFSRPLLWVLLGFIVAVSVWTPLSQESIARRWFTLPNTIFFSPVPLLVAVFSIGLCRSLKGEPHAAPFLYVLGLVFLGYTGLAISLWPMVIPPDITIWDAAAPLQSQGFALLGALGVIPFILMYTAWSYYVFRGKVRAGDGYH